MNPESPTSVQEIRNQTDLFLDQFSYSQYAPFVGLKTQDLLSDYDVGPFLQAQLASGIVPDPYLTGADPACLPMTFRIIDKTGTIALEFTLLVNPTNMNHGKTSTVGALYTREGFVTQMWGPNQDLLTVTGSSAAFMVEGIGLTAVGRRRSFGFLNFTALLATYRNNGYMLGDPTLESGLTRVINKITGIELTYDNQSYMGHFNNFTIDENADNPFRFNFNFDFVVSMLSTDYNEVRGHFSPITKQLYSDPVAATPLVNDITDGQSSNIKVPPYQYVNDKITKFNPNVSNDVLTQYGRPTFPKTPSVELLPQTNTNYDVNYEWAVPPAAKSGRSGGGGATRTWEEAEVKNENPQQAAAADQAMNTSPLMNTNYIRMANGLPSVDYNKNLNLNSQQITNQASTNPGLESSFFRMANGLPPVGQKP